jgi:chondroitin 4-sulfotransferase 11
MINREHKFIFIHIPKTGGTSIEALFDQSFYGWDDKFCLWKQHCSIHQMQSVYGIDVDSYYKFAIVRNPWDRAVSDYKWWTRPNSPFFDFLNNTTLEDYLLIRNGYEKINHLNDSTGRADHFYTQYSFVEIGGACVMDCIIKFENLQQDFNIFCDQIGMPQQKLPHTNKTNRKHYSEYYNQKTIDIVAQKYHKDIEYFDYQF